MSVVALYIDLFVASNCRAIGYEFKIRVSTVAGINETRDISITRDYNRMVKYRVGD